MDEQLFLHIIQVKAKELGINPLLLISGIEGVYTFREVQLNEINYEFLDSLILTIFALRIGDSFHSIAEGNLSSNNQELRSAANFELKELSNEEIAQSGNSYLQSFAGILQGKSPIRRYHEKAIEVAALEVKKAQLGFGNSSISSIILHICKTELNHNINFATLFG